MIHLKLKFILYYLESEWVNEMIKMKYIQFVVVLFDKKFPMIEEERLKKGRSFRCIKSNLNLNDFIIWKLDWLRID